MKEIFEFDLYKFAQEVAKENGFKFTKDKPIHEGRYYSVQNIRNISLEGEYQNKPALLKVFNDPRMRDDGGAQKSFNKHNKSKILLAPRVYEYGRVSPTRGWFIMEKLPDGHVLESPLPKEKRGFFLELYIEYFKNSLANSYRPLTLIETFSAYDFHRHRIDRWVELANEAEARLVLEGKKPLLDFEQFNSYFRKGLEVIKKVYDRKALVWCPHSLVRPNRIFKVSDKDKYYLLDFCRAGMRPNGYELAVIIWADWIMTADWQMEYSVWKNGIMEWIDKIRKMNEIMKIDNISFIDEFSFSELMSVALTERILETILADVCANKDMPRDEKNGRIVRLYKFLDEMCF